MDFSSAQTFLILAPVFILSVVIHEVAHGAVALAFGDPTAKALGRLTLNPLKHIDPVGSILLPGTMLLLGSLSGTPGPIFGWAKPVPYNPYLLRHQRWGPALVGLAGPGANFALAVIFGLLIRMADSYAAFLPVHDSLFILHFFSSIVFLNLWLALFNLVPIPPLDGSKLLPILLPRQAGRQLEIGMAHYGPFFILFLFFFLFQFLIPVVARLTLLLFRLVTGVS